MIPQDSLRITDARGVLGVIEWHPFGPDAPEMVAPLVQRHRAELGDGRRGRTRTGTSVAVGDAVLSYFLESSLRVRAVDQEPAVVTPSATRLVEPPAEVTYAVLVAERALSIVGRCSARF
jgi:ABC-type sulfate transport system substrate-binding protein